MGKKEVRKVAAVQKPPETLSNVSGSVVNNLTIGGSVVMALLAYLLYRVGLPTEVIYSQNKDVDTLKLLLMGEDPGVFYCHRGGRREEVPQVFNELNSELGSYMNFAVLNCSQVLPSGKTIYERFRINLNEKPTVFATVPWGKPRQIGPKNLKDLRNFRESVEKVTTARAARVSTNRDFARECSTAAMNERETCIVMIRGGKFTTNMVKDIEENLVKQFPKMNVVILNGAKYRLSFEKENSARTADNFSLRIHAIRQGGYYLSMDPTTIISWTNVEKFVYRSIETVFDDYNGYGDINVINASELALKTIHEPIKRNQDLDLPPITDSRVQEIKLKKQLDQKEKELLRREQMDESMKKGIFEEEDKEGKDVNGELDDASNEMEDEEVMELV